MSRAIHQKNNPDGFVKPGELVDIRAGVELSLQDRRIFNLLIDNAWSEIGEDKHHRIAISRLRGPRHRGGERVAESIETLMHTSVKVPTTLDGEPAIFATQLLGSTTRTIDEDSAKATLVYEFPRGLREIIKNSQYWGRIKAYVMFAFTSKYALALYEAVCLRINLRSDEQTFTVDEFRDLIGVPADKLPLFKNLKKWAVDLAVVEVNALSDFTVEVEPIRQGGQLRGLVTGFRVHWRRKEAEEWQHVLDELMRTSVGRRARISGKVEPADDDLMQGGRLRSVT